MKRRILLVDDEVAVLLTLKAVLEISGFEVDTAASAREGKHKLHTRVYEMVISDMRMESDSAGTEVVQAARRAAYKPAIALLTAFPVAEEDWQEMGADRMLVKPMHTRVLLEQIEHLLTTHQSKLTKGPSASAKKSGPGKAVAKKVAVPKTAAKKMVVKKAVVKPVATNSVTAKKAVTKTAVAKKAVTKTAVAKPVVKTAGKASGKAVVKTKR